MTLNKIKQGIVKGTPLINYKEIGKGPPVIFLHGIGAVSYTHLTLPTKA